jgi:glycosyltransferase involved in cell wall biosynthesis
VSHIAFVTTELAPHTPGGAGVLVSELRRELSDAGHRVSIVLASQPTEPVSDPGIVIADGDDPAGWDLPFMTVSKAAAEALAGLHATDPVDLVEIQDFDGLAFWTLTHRRDLGVAEIPVLVRFHGPVDLQTLAVGVSDPELDAAGAMERECFAMADGVVVPSDGIADLVADRYGVDEDRIVVGPPVIRRLGDAARWEAGGSNILVIGRLAEVKGSHDMVDAVVPILDESSEATVTFVGGDGWSATARRPMGEWLTDRIPGRLTDRIRFVDWLDRTELAQQIRQAMVVVVPSRFESFNLAVHEARGLGAPVIVPDIAAFATTLDEAHGAIVYDGTVAGLTAALRRAATDPGFMASLAARSGPDVGDPLAAYTQRQPPVRHLRSQGGLATAALARVEEVWLEPRRLEPPPTLGRRILGSIPDGLYRSLRSVVPRALKERVRATGDLSVEMERRWWEDRFTAGMEHLASMEAASVPVRVSVIIPCYNQGAFIRDALMSVFEQSVDDLEVVIIDDGSDDGTTPGILDRLHSPRVRVVRQDNRGLPAARNAGIEAARGSLVVTLDADDELHPSFIATLSAALENHPDAAYAHCWAELFGDTHMMWATRPYNPYQLMLSNSVVGCVLMRREACLSVGGYDASMTHGNEDWDLWIRLMAAGFGAVQVREPLFRYRKHGVSMSVETEARYEMALEDRSSRHPDLYTIDALATMKRSQYPLVTILSSGAVSVHGDEPIDSQQLAIGSGDVSSVVDDVRGKYVVYLDEGTSVSAGALLEMCLTLEEHDDWGAVLSEAPSPACVVRTWSLFDPDGPSDVHTLPVQLEASRRLGPGDHPVDSWMVPSEIRGVPVLRQRPEEAGTIPDWIRS